MKKTLALILAMFAAPASADRITHIQWVDGDSGTLWTAEYSGVKFRLANYDAPETSWRAECNWEIEQGYDSRGFMRGLTERAIEKGALETGDSHGTDRYGRLVIDIIVKGHDLGDFAASKGYLKPWPFEGGKALAPKPDWC